MNRDYKLYSGIYTIILFRLELFNYFICVPVNIIITIIIIYHHCLIVRLRPSDASMMCVY